jgi:hypothetical protein
MRKIEAQMVDAILDCRNWKSGNTEVQFFDGVSFVFLHGNCIAQVKENSVSLFDGGWQSATTKSRLNAILKAHGIKGECVFQRNFKWFVHKFIGQAGSSPVFVEQDFTNGMRLA